MKAITSQVLVAFALAGLVLPPQAFAATTVEGVDGTVGYSGIPMLDGSKNKVYCSQTADGPRVLLPGGSTITLNACSSSTMYSTDVGSVLSAASGIPVAGTNGKLDTSWLTTVPASLLPPPLYVETVTVTSTASDSSTSTAVQLNLGINTATVSRWYTEPQPVMEILKTDGVSRTQPTSVLVLNAQGDRLTAGTYAGTGLEFRGKSVGNLANWQQARISTFPAGGANGHGLQFEVRPTSLYFLSPVMMLNYNGLFIGDSTEYIQGAHKGFLEVKPLPAPSSHNLPTLVLHSRRNLADAYDVYWDLAQNMTLDGTILGGMDYLGRAYYKPASTGRNTYDDDATIAVNPRAATSKGVVITGLAGQTGDLLRASDANGTAVAAISADGKVSGANLVSAAGGNVFVTGSGTATGTTGQTSLLSTSVYTISNTATHMSGDVPTDRTIAVGGGLAVITGIGTATATQTSGSLAQNITVTYTNTATTQTHLIVTPNAVKTWTDSLTLAATDVATTSPSPTAIPLAGTNSKVDVGWLPAATAPTASMIPIAGTNSKIDVGWIPNLSSSYVPTSTTITYPGKVVTLSANSTVTATDIGQTAAQAGKIPVGDSNARIDAWVSGYKNLNAISASYDGVVTHQDNGTWGTLMTASFTAPTGYTTLFVTYTISMTVTNHNATDPVTCMGRATVNGTPDGNYTYATIAGPGEAADGFATLSVSGLKSIANNGNTQYVSFQFTSSNAVPCYAGYAYGPSGYIVVTLYGT